MRPMRNCVRSSTLRRLVSPPWRQTEPLRDVNATFCSLIGLSRDELMADESQLHQPTLSVVRAD